MKEKRGRLARRVQTTKPRTYQNSSRGKKETRRKETLERRAGEKKAKLGALAAGPGSGTDCVEQQETCSLPAPIASRVGRARGPRHWTGRTEARVLCTRVALSSKASADQNESFKIKQRTSSLLTAILVCSYALRARDALVNTSRARGSASAHHIASRFFFVCGCCLALHNHLPQMILTQSARLAASEARYSPRA